MDRIERFFGLKREAKVRYMDGAFEVGSGGGDFVKCAVTGEAIALADLRYWSVERAEAYSSPAAALKRHLDVLSAKA